MIASVVTAREIQQNCNGDSFDTTADTTFMKWFVRASTRRNIFNRNEVVSGLR
jgi:hypothetical protein